MSRARYLLFFSAVLLLLLAWAKYALAQANCAPRDFIAMRLATGYGEALQSRGYINETQILEIYVAQDTGTWTVLTVQSNGNACVLTSGQHFVTLPPEPKGIDG